MKTLKEELIMVKEKHNRENELNKEAIEKLIKNNEENQN